VRWILNGTKRQDGQLVRLEALRMGSRWITSVEAIQRFAEALTPGAQPAPKPPHQGGVKAAMKRLEAAGF